MSRSIFALLAFTLSGCFLPASPRPDAGAPDAACFFPESCPPGCNPTPCGCATDNPAIECGVL